MINPEETVRVRQLIETTLTNEATKGQNARLRQTLSEYILSGFKFVNQFMSLYYYDESTGCWFDHGEELVERELRDLSPYLTRSHCAEAQTYIKGISTTVGNRIEFSLPINEKYLNTKKGVFDIQNRIYLPHAPEYYFTNYLPLDYDETATSPEILKFLVDLTFPYPKKFVTLLEQAASLLVGENREHILFLNVGRKFNGKTTWNNLLRVFVGEGNYSALSLEELASSRFALPQIVNKLANFSSEGSGESGGKPLDMETIKRITGEDKITLDQKFKEPYSYSPKIIPFFSMNKLPRNQPDDALAERMLITEFTNTFVSNEEKERLQSDGKIIRVYKHKEPEILKRIVSPRELSGFFNILLPIRQNLMKRGFSNRPSSIEMKRRYALWAQESVSLFRLDCVRYKKDSIIAYEDLYKLYLEYCSNMELHSADKEWFSRRFNHTDIRGDVPYYDTDKYVYVYSDYIRDSKRIHNYHNIEIVLPEISNLGKNLSSINLRQNFYKGLENANIGHIIPLIHEYIESNSLYTGKIITDDYQLTFDV